MDQQLTCVLCDNTGYKDHAGFAMDPCDHGEKAFPFKATNARDLFAGSYIAIDIKRNPLPVLGTRDGLPEIPGRRLLRRVRNMLSEILKLGDQHRDDNLVARFVLVRDGHEPLSIIIEEPADLDRILATWRNHLETHAQPSPNESSDPILAETACRDSDTTHRNQSIPQADERSMALAAAEATSAATLNLIGFARDGRATSRFPFADEVVAQLVEALTLACKIELPSADEDEAAAIHQLSAALTQFGKVFER